ncbi:hypothetical protein MUU74_08035 [Chryseobacterium daecheongense]|uniref:hypothetical protein n=1 Tax=Chryseobacterium daecheongense TaxID=192389 RepID=UPI001FD6BB84|nr:hypothetical protein [Chryseobacterium daecheongense]UOU99890.1 hypothetical protein MUU74_08035 [Chryseobacterium daecheongense]
MKKLFFTLGLFSIGSAAFSQVGINNQNPQATLDVTAKALDGSKPEGLIAPRLTGDQIKSGDTQYGSNQKGALVYATSAVTSTSPKTVNITNEGYYYFDGSIWQKLNGGSANAVLANNGLTNNSGVIQLGGSLIQPTTVTTTATNLLTISGNSSGAIKIVDGSQGEGKFLVSDANGVATWRTNSGTTVIQSTAGTNAQIGTFYALTGASAVVSVSGYYLIDVRLATDKVPANCGLYFAYNLWDSPNVNIHNQAFPLQDIHVSGGMMNDFAFGSNVAYLTAGTYYLVARSGPGCTSNITRTTLAENGFTLTLLK